MRARKSALRQGDDQGIDLLPGVVEHSGEIEGVIRKNAVRISVEDDQGFEIASPQVLQDLVNQGYRILVGQDINEVNSDRPERFVQAIGNAFDDYITIDFTRLMAEEIGGFQAPPNLV